MKWVSVGALGGVLVAVSAAMAGGACELEELVSKETAADVTPSSEIRVQTGSPVAAKALEVVVKGGPSESVTVVAPPSVAVTAIGGNGEAGQPGSSARQ